MILIEIFVFIIAILFLYFIIKTAIQGDKSESIAAFILLIIMLITMLTD